MSWIGILAAVALFLAFGLLGRGARRTSCKARDCDGCDLKPESCDARNR